MGSRGDGDEGAAARAPARISHLFMHVSDLERSRDFYTRVIGLELLREEPGYLRVGTRAGFHIGMEQRPPERVGAPGVEIAIEVDDVTAAYERMHALGVGFDGPPEPQDWGPAHAWFRDPDGYRLSIYA